MQVHTDSNITVIKLEKLNIADCEDKHYRVQRGSWRTILAQKAKMRAEPASGDIAECSPGHRGLGFHLAERAPEDLTSLLNLNPSLMRVWV